MFYYSVPVINCKRKLSQFAFYKVVLWHFSGAVDKIHNCWCPISTRLCARNYFNQLVHFSRSYSENEKGAFSWGHRFISSRVTNAKVHIGTRSVDIALITRVRLATSSALQWKLI